MLLLTTTVARVRTYLMTRRIQSVLRGLSEIRLDQTSEEELTKELPHLLQRSWNTDGRPHRLYYIQISNESDRLPGAAIVSLSEKGFRGLEPDLERIADLLGYRFLSFDAGILVEQGKVVQLDYGLANQWVRPQFPGYTGYIVSARSVHGYWIDRRIPFSASSKDDLSPQYRANGAANGIFLTYTADAPPDRTQRAFQLSLTCFWGIHGCDDARVIAPGLWHDIESIRDETYQQLISGKCPDSLVEGRMRYVPDLTVSLLEVTGSRRVEVSEEGDRAEDWLIDYKLKEAVRGKSAGPWTNIRFRRTIPDPRDETRTMLNQTWHETRVGTQVLFFSDPRFYSCRFIPATTSALEIVRKTPLPFKRAEDRIPWGLQ